MCKFDTKTEEAFYNLMTLKGIKCEKIQDKKSPAPDFLCDLNGYKAVFELKEFAQSGTTLKLGKNFIAQSITLTGAAARFMDDSKKKFLNPLFKNLPSALVITNLRPLLRWETIIDQVEKALRDNFANFPQIGNVILTGYNKPSNSIIALHIFENRNSVRSINRDFFLNFKCKYYDYLFHHPKITT